MEVITKLKNPKTNLYREIKDYEFKWEYKPSSQTNPEFYSHEFLSRPEVENRIVDPYYPSLEKFLYEVFEYNNIKVSNIFRVNANKVYPSGVLKTTPPHIDHEFPHKNMIIYLSDSGGETICFTDDSMELHNPEEDDIIIFDGVLHCHNTPKERPRIVLVTTYE